jgi:hypothetical protein
MGSCCFPVTSGPAIVDRHLLRSPHALSKLQGIMRPRNTSYISSHRRTDTAHSAQPRRQLLDLRLRQTSEPRGVHLLDPILCSSSQRCAARSDSPSSAMNTSTPTRPCPPTPTRRGSEGTSSPDGQQAAGLRAGGLTLVKSGLYSRKFRGCQPQAPGRRVVPRFGRRRRRPALVEILSADARHLWR